ncbi:MAG TPA: hypothetical protein VMI12_06795 [Puia sp.]|nr:hypothetical protein [Puia sp.]
MKRRTLLFFLSAFFLSTVRSQSADPVLKLYATQYEQERVHIHFDKDAYLPGETVWMKAYILCGSKPSGISKNIYFDWTDSYGNLIYHSVAPITESVATGSFIVPPFLTGGAVHVKAYTQWMLNFDSSFLFNKDIAVLTSWDGNLLPEKHNTSIQFFAEGGDLVNGLPSVIAFEAMDQRGTPVEVKGVVKKSNGDIIDSFSTMHRGMGTLSLRPISGETYTAFWKDEFGESHTTPLPQVKTTGAVMRITPEKDNSIHFQVERPADCPDNFKSLTMIATMHQNVLYQSAIDLSTKTMADDDMNVSSFPSGVLQITLFDAHMVPFAERVAFVNNHQYEFAAQFRKELVNLNKRGRNEISIEVPDSLSSSLSVSVTDGGLGSDTSNNIITDFLLSSDIKGNIVDPAYYFSTNQSNSNFYLDLVMRTHGWRRFKWQDVNAGKLPQIQYPADSDYMKLKGQVFAPQSGFDASDSITLLIITKDRKKQILNLPLNANGSFMQKGIFFYDSAQIVYKLNHPAKMNSNSSVRFQTGLLSQGILSNTRASDPEFIWTKVPDVVLEKESGGNITELHNYSRLSLAMTYVFSPANRNDQTKNSYETASHFLQNNFPDLKFPYAPKESGDPTNNQENRYTSYSVNNPSQQQAFNPQKNNVNLSLDGVLVNMDDLKQLNMKEVLFIKFIQKTSPKDLPTLSITSRQSIDQNNIMNNKAGFAVITGYTPAKEFYSPQYADIIEDHPATDFRSTLYWNPHIVTDKNHRKIKLVFYNNDISNKFRIVIEGMNKEGKLIRVEEIIK